MRIGPFTSIIGSYLLDTLIYLYKVDQRYVSERTPFCDRWD
jgi:hypothetical protein